MARFFRGMGAPVRFEGAQVAQGGGSAGGRVAPAPSDEQKKRDAVRTAKAGAYIEAVKTVDAGAIAPDATGMTLNVPGQTQYSETQYLKNLEQLGYPDFAQDERKRAEDLRQAELVTANKHLDQQLRVAEVSASLALAGDTQGAFRTYNQYAEEGAKAIAPFQVIDADTVFVKTEDDPEGKPFKRSELARLQADAKSRMDTWLPTRTEVKGDKLIATQQHALTGELKQVYSVDWNPAGANSKAIAQAKDLWQWYTQLQSTKSFAAIKEARYRAHAVAADENSPGDLALLKTYARATEPEGRTITDSDFNQVERARELAARLGVSIDTYNSLLSGKGSLSPGDRKRFVNSIENMYNTKLSEQREVTDKAFYARAKAEGLPVSLIDPVEQLYIEPQTFKKYDAAKADAKKAGYPTPEVEEVEGKKTADGKTPIFNKKTKEFIRYK